MNRPRMLTWFLFAILAIQFTGCSKPASRGDVRVGRDTMPELTRSRLKIAIDPGHGGEDYGTHSVSKPYYHEKYLTLATAMMVRDHLKRLGYQVMLTRDKDIFISLDQRVNMAHRRGADIFVSLHYNAASNKNAHGVEVYFFDSNMDGRRTAQSRSLADDVLHGVLGQTQARSRGVKAGNFAVIRNTKIPAILVEGGFLTSQSEMSQLKDPKHLNRIAFGIAQGVDKYLHVQ